MTGRRAFTAFEIVIAMSVLAVVIVVTAQVSYQAMQERMRNDVRQKALEAANNTLETARALPWEALTPPWAAGQRLPEEWKELQPDGELKVRVEPDTGLPQVKRVTVTVRWDFRDGIPPQELELTTLIGGREILQRVNQP
jgi:type II secretory pathway pseudopilin PulG